MLMRTDPFRELDRLTQQLLNTSGTWSRPSAMPMDAYREGEEYVIALDLPGVSTDAIDIDVERNMLTVKAERRPVTKADDVQMELSERPLGVFSRQIVLADTSTPSTSRPTTTRACSPCGSRSPSVPSPARSPSAKDRTATRSPAEPETPSRASVEGGAPSPSPVLRLKRRKKRWQPT